MTNWLDEEEAIFKAQTATSDSRLACSRYWLRWNIGLAGVSIVVAMANLILQIAIGRSYSWSRWHVALLALTWLAVAGQWGAYAMQRRSARAGNKEWSRFWAGVEERSAARQAAERGGLT